MLQAIRERTGGIIGGIIIALLIIPFAFWGVDSWQTTQIEDWVAKVNDTEISQPEYQRKYRLYQQSMEQEYGRDTLGADFFDDPVRKREFVESLIAEELFLQLAEKSGIAVSNAEVQATIAADPGFQAGGVFSHDLYRRLLSAQGHSPASWEAFVRRGRILTQVRGGMLDSAIVTDVERDNLLQLRDQTRSFRYINLASEGFREGIEPTEEEIEAHYNEHTEDYQSPEMVAVEYLELDADDLTSEVEVSDATLRERYEEAKHRFTTPESRRVSHILFELPPGADEDAKEILREQAADISSRAKEGEDFAELALAYSDDIGTKESGGDLDWVLSGDMVPEFDEAVFSMEEGAISDPVETQFGYHVIWVREVAESEGQSFEEVRDQLAQEYRDEQGDTLFLNSHQTLVNATYEHENTLEPAAELLGLEVKTSEPFGRSGGEGVLAHPKLLEVAFSAQAIEEQRNSDSIDLGPNHVAVIRVIEHTPSALKPLEEVREEVVEAVITEKARAAAEERAQALVARVEAGESLDQIAESEALEVIDAEAVSRNALTHDRTMVNGVFELARPDAESEIVDAVESNTGTAVVVLSEVQNAEVASLESQLLQQASQLRENDFLRAEYAAIVDSLKSKAEVSISEDRL